MGPGIIIGLCAIITGRVYYATAPELHVYLTERYGDPTSATKTRDLKGKSGIIYVQKSATAGNIGLWYSGKIYGSKIVTSGAKALLLYETVPGKFMHRYVKAQLLFH